MISGQNVDEIRFAASMMHEANQAIAVTGAGISTPSGIPDFRSPSSSLRPRYDPMQVTSLTSFLNKPQCFFEWARQVALKIVEAELNQAHLALANLKRNPHLTGIISQNIDDLHLFDKSK